MCSKIGVIDLNRRKECGSSSEDKVKNGVFGATMKVDIANDGPGMDRTPCCCAYHGDLEPKLGTVICGYNDIFPTGLNCSRN